MSDQENNPVEENEIEDYELFESAIDDFIIEIDALAETLPLTMGLVGIKVRNKSKRLEQFVQEHSSEEDGEKKFKIPLDKFNLFNRLDNELNSAEAAQTILPRHFLVSLVSQYDAYLGELYRTLFDVNDKLLFSLDREFTFQELLKFEDIDEVKDFMIEKDVESLLCESHYEQLKTIEKRVTKMTGKEFTLTSDLPVLPTFIEATERRNLFVHCNGLVSRQYIENCKKHNVNGIEKIKINELLHAGPMYFNSAYQAIFEVGVKLGQVLWRKFLPANLVEADKNLNNIAYDLIYNGYYDLAKTLLHFGTETIKKNGSQEMRKTLMINKALAYYLDNDKKTSQKILNSEDWSIGLEFKLSVAILNENYDEAKKLMLKIGPEDEAIDKEAYQEWPLFKRFRDSDVFKETYKELFKEDFIIREAPEKAFISLVKKIKDKKKDKENQTHDKKD